MTQETSHIVRVSFLQPGKVSALYHESQPLPATVPTKDSQRSSLGRKSPTADHGGVGVGVGVCVDVGDAVGVKVGVCVDVGVGVEVGVGVGVCVGDCVEVGVAVGVSVGVCVGVGERV